MIYFRYSEGYRGGGFIGFPGSAAAAVSYDPETARSYEGGVRTGWFNDRLLFNVTLFKTDFSNLQRSAAVPAPNGGFVQVTANVAAATTKGFEIESVASLGRHFRLRANVGYLSARFTDYSVINTATGELQDLSSTPFPFAPKWTVSVSPELTLPLHRTIMGFDTLDLRGRLGWQSTVYVSSATINDFGLQRDYALFDASARLSGESGLSLTLFVKNLFDRHYITSHSNPSNLVDVVADGAPRTIGINIGYRF
jgi:iron complex outermembrane receptor protein